MFFVFLLLEVIGITGIIIHKRFTSPGRGQLTDWLQKKDSYPIVDLSYLEVGMGSQSIHMEFGDGGVAYTLLVRDSARCKRFFGLLTGKVAAFGLACQ